MNVFEFLGLPKLHRKPDKVVQLVKHREQANQKKLKYPVLGQVKKDGVYCLIVCFNGQVKFFSRTGKRFTNCEVLEAAWWAASKSSDTYVVLAELCNEHYSLEQFSGLVNPNRVKVLDSGDIHKLTDSVLYMHDTVTVEEFIAGVSCTNYPTRSYRLELHHSDKPYSCFLNYNDLHSAEEVEEYADALIFAGEEGAVFKHPDAGWVAGRRDHEVTKEVRGLHVDLEVVGVEEGKKGKRKSTTGNLLCRWRRGGKPDGEVVVIPVDGKYTDEQRYEWFLFPEKVVGRILHVKALQMASKGLLRLPKGQELRVDKETADF